MIIDASKWQGDIDWKKVKAAGVTHAYLKTSQGVGYMDPDVKEDSALAAAVGVQVGYYHFASLNDHNEVPDAKAEARYFISIVRQLPKPGMPLVLDIEKNEAGLSKEEVLAWIKAFFMELQAIGYGDFALYSYTPFLNANLPVNHGLGGVKLWSAAYALKCKVPTGWPGYWLWQYTSKGRVDGIKGDVDLNKYE